MQQKTMSHARIVYFKAHCPLIQGELQYGARFLFRPNNG